MSAGVHATWDKTLLLRLEARIRCYKGSFRPLSCLLISPDGQLPRHLDDGRSFLVKRERTHRRRTDPAAQTMAATCRDKSCNPFWRPCSHDLSLSLAHSLAYSRLRGLWHLLAGIFLQLQRYQVSRVCRMVESNASSLAPIYHARDTLPGPAAAVLHIETNCAK